MVRVYVSAVIPADINKVWAAIRDFNGLPDWHPLIADSQIEDGLAPSNVGCIRNFNLRDGGNIREQLLTLSDLDRSCTYSILESPMALTNYRATLRVTQITESAHSFAEWWANFDCALEVEKELVEMIGRDVFAGGFEALQKRF